MFSDPYIPKEEHCPSVNSYYSKYDCWVEAGVFYFVIFFFFFILFFFVFFVLNPLNMSCRHKLLALLMARTTAVTTQSAALAVRAPPTLGSSRALAQPMRRRCCRPRHRRRCQHLRTRTCRMQTTVR